MEASVSYSLQETPDGGVELMADSLFEASVCCLDDLYKKIASRVEEVQAVATCTFWHSLVGVDAEGRAITPVFLWADVRSRNAAAGLRQDRDEREYHRRTGCMFHHSYLPAKFLWLQESQPELLDRALRWMSFGEYLHARFLGYSLSSISMASATGLFNQHTQQWDEEILRHLPVDRSRLSELGDFDSEMPALAAEYGKRWPKWGKVRWIPALGDGATSNLGSGCVTQNELALMVGTSGAMRVCWETRTFEIRPGLWCYRADRNRIVMGGALSNGGILFSWLRETFRLPPADQLESLLAQMQPDSHGLTVLPFLLGERSPEWADHARGAIVGLTLQTTPLQILRACLEAVACRFALIQELLREVVAKDARIVATGGALMASDVWKQIMADVLGRPIVASEEREASSRGATLLALRALGVVSGLQELPAATGKVFQPDVRRSEIYREAIERQRELFRKIINDRRS
jgi:gluconokinase